MFYMRGFLCLYVCRHINKYISTQMNSVNVQHYVQNLEDSVYLNTAE